MKLMVNLTISLLISQAHSRYTDQTHDCPIDLQINRDKREPLSYQAPDLSSSGYPRRRGKKHQSDLY